MGRYRKVDSRIWNDEKFMALSDKGKLAFLFIMTHPHMTSLGAMRATIDGLASEINWTPKVFGDAFGEAVRKGMARHDEKSCFICLPNFLRYNGPESPNVVKGWAGALDLLPECAEKAKLIQRVVVFIGGLPEGFRKVLPEVFRKALAYSSGRPTESLPEDLPIPFGKGMPNQEPEQEPEQDTPQSPPRGGRFQPPTIDEVAAYCRERQNSVDPQQWYDHYSSNGWKVGRNPMKDWKAAVRTWEKSEFNLGKFQGTEKQLTTEDRIAEQQRQREEMQRRREEARNHANRDRDESSPQRPPSAEPT